MGKRGSGNQSSPYSCVERSTRSTRTTHRVKYSVATYEVANGLDLSVPAWPRVDRVDEVDQVGEIRGRALLKGRTDHSGITISVFNGFGKIANVTSPDGSYCVPIVRSTDGTYITVFTIKSGFLPDARNVRITGLASGHSG